MAKTLADVLDAQTREGELYERLDGNKLRCHACGHRCVIFEGHRGICQVRFNAEGALRVPWGYVAGLQNDPTEKKPFFHVLPGSDTLTFGMLGCDYHCSYCQNWLTSQALRDPNAGTRPRSVTPEEMMSLAKRHGARMVTSSYNEPLITAEWAVGIFRLAREAGLRTAFVSNGNATREVLEYLRPWTDCFKIDLKSMDDKNYRHLGGVLDHVLRTIEMVHEMGLWTEIVTLVVPGWNDSLDELQAAAEFIAGVSPDIPWHVTAFHKDYKMQDPPNTSLDTLLHAAEIGRDAGLNYVYAGNLPGGVGRWENTYCPNCEALLVERYGYIVQRQQVTPDGHCPNCGHPIAGIWS
ncbi:MAG: Pyruvate formate-lyase 1-activating enzyme [Anaerolineales bacterium]|nr:Pyruvate formate-lyase 1-activating enzyme [Anaerolineales bacterium]